MTLFVVGMGIIFCVVMSGIFSASEMALSSSNMIRLENEAKEGKKGAQIAIKLIDNYDDTLSVILLSNNLVNIAASSLSTVYIILLTGSDTREWIMTIIVTVLIIVFGETVPKVLSRHYANSIAIGVAGFIRVLQIILKPLNLIVVKLTNVITKPFDRAADRSDDEESSLELQQIIETAEDEGVIDAETSDLVANAIDFSEVSASDVMTARVDVEAIDIYASSESIRNQIISSTRSRFPIYEGSIDNVIGIVHQNQLLKAYASEENPDIRKIMISPCFVYKTAKLPHVLEVLKKARVHMAIVTDEYSGTCGAITMEDVLEEIVGDIWDETDIIVDEVVRLQDGSLIVDGDMAIDDFLEYINVKEDEFHYDSQTVGGWCIEYIGDFPKQGDSFDYNNIKIKIIEVGVRRVEKVELVMSE